MSPQDGESKAQDAAHQAVALAKVWLKSHNALGSVMLGLWTGPKQRTEFKRAIELNPSYFYRAPPVRGAPRDAKTP